MEALVQELANLLEITYTQAKEMYPILRSQFIVYRAIQVVNLPMLLLFLGGFAMAIVNFFQALGIMDDAEYDLGKTRYSGITREEQVIMAKRQKQIDKHFFRVKKSTLALLLLLFIHIGLRVTMYILAADLMMIKEFIL